VAIDINALHSLREAAPALKRKEHSLRRSIGAGDLKAIRVGARWYLHTDEIERVQREGLPIPFSKERRKKRG
jgi:hypothetical protein